MATILYVLHVLGAVLWVGGMAFAILVLRPAAHGVLEGPQRLALMQEVFRRFFRVLWHVVPIILLTGWTIFGLSYWGFGASVWHVHLMNLTGIVMTGVFLYVTMVPWKAMRAAIATAASFWRSCCAETAPMSSRYENAPRYAIPPAGTSSASTEST